MTKFTSHLDDAGPATVQYESVLTVDSAAVPGVRFAIRRVSLARRNELIQRVRELSVRSEFLNAGEGLQERIEASLLTNELEALYVRWGLVRVFGLSIDGGDPTVEALIESGPEELTREIGAAVRRQIGLSEEERKN